MIGMRTSKTSRRRTEWIFCLASWTMTALISLQAVPPGVADTEPPKPAAKFWDR